MAEIGEVWKVVRVSCDLMRLWSKQVMKISRHVEALVRYDQGPELVFR